MWERLKNTEYLDTPEQWDELAQLLTRAGVFGLDTEFYNVDLKKKSPVGRSKIHVWSVAIRTSRLDPRGFRRARGWCLPVAALQWGPLRAVLEDPGVRKAVHNQPVDHHALRNHGVALRGAINTLDLLRWTHPGLINDPGRFQLKPNMERLLRRSPVCTFKELVTYKQTVQRSTFRTVKTTVCSCGEPGCRLRKPDIFGEHTKSKVEERIETVHEREVDAEYPLEEIVPGHPRFNLLVRYATEDAVAAVEFLEICENTPNPAPFPYTTDGVRPAFNQEDVEATVEMETVGIPIDCGYAYAMADKAALDEEESLTKLHQCYLALTGGSAERDDVDPIWSSPVQLIALFDALGFPRSPIWGKGKVKGDDVKLDQTALEWIARNHPRGAELIHELIRLKRIRSGMKYLIKLRDSGGMVHPTCGPSGDDDGRAGAVTGRKGVKVELEAQQLPSQEVKDLYAIRKAIVAVPDLLPDDPAYALQQAARGLL